MTEKLTLACGVYDLTYPLINGLVESEGIDLNILSNFRSIDHFERMYAYSEFDVCEFSLTLHLISWDRGDRRFIGLPILLNRQFVQKNLYRKIDSGISVPKDLEGRSVGLPIYQNARWIWTRGILEDYYGVETNKIKWYTERPERLDLKMPPDVKLEQLPRGMTSVEALETGLIDAIGSFRNPNSKQVTKLFPNIRAEEKKYFQKTKMLPAMHIIVVKREILERSPWVAQALMRAFQRSKELCYEIRDKLSEQGGSSNIWMNDNLTEQNELLGNDPYPFGLKANGPELKLWADYSQRQGFISSKPDIPSLFATGTDAVRGTR